MSGASDPYSLLGVPPGASAKQIKAAHRKLAKRYHPDSPTADAQRFLRVQEAYQLLADPLRRREWDARHSPAPMRADETAAPPPRGRRAQAGSAASADPGAPTGERAGRRRRPMTEPPAEAAARSYTWSASEVPWWEEGREARRARRAQAASSASTAAGDRPASPTEAAADTPADRSPSGSARPDFDVYSRSSGAAWSSAARAYFRRVDQDLPRRGSFHHQGAQPLTAARARVAAEEEARRRARSGTAKAGGPTTTPRRPAAARPAAPPPAPAAGVAHDAETITTVRAMARERDQAAHWPTLSQRLRIAALAWLPIALLVAYGGPVAAGCADAPAGCAQLLTAAQSAIATGTLAALVALPRLAYIGAVASSAIIVSGGTALLGAWLLGVRPPQAASLPGWAILTGAIVLLGAYVVAAAWLLGERSRLPWVGPRMPHES
jgi:curved DNA-binding protein CbpA